MKTKTILARIACATSLLPLLLLLAATAAVQAQDYYYTTNDGMITITYYAGPDADVTIPDTVDGLPVTIIGERAFLRRSRLTSVIIPNSVTNIGERAFELCGLTSVNIPNSVFTIGKRAFYQSGLTNVNIGNSVTSIGEAAFLDCSNLITVTIGNSVTTIGDYAFALGTTNLSGYYFKGNAPSLGSEVFFDTYQATVYYLPGTTGWGAAFGGLPTALWNPQAQTTDPSFGVRKNQFGFAITGNSNLVIVVEACTNLTNPAWMPLRTTTLTNGSSYFSDPQWANYPARFYRLRSP